MHLCRYLKPGISNRQIFNVGNPKNEIAIKDLAYLMIELYKQIAPRGSFLQEQRSSHRWSFMARDMKILTDVFQISRKFKTCLDGNLRSI
jgi:nucleoside-diphosphate-sugar epimerase